MLMSSDGGSPSFQWRRGGRDWRHSSRLMDKVFLKCSKADTLLCGISFPLFSGGRKTHQYVERNLIGSSPVYRLTIVSFIEMSMCPIQNISQPDLSQVKHEDLASRTLGTA